MTSQLISNKNKTKTKVLLPDFATLTVGHLIDAHVESSHSCNLLLAYHQMQSSLIFYLKKNKVFSQGVKTSCENLFRVSRISNSTIENYFLPGGLILRVLQSRNNCNINFKLVQSENKKKIATSCNGVQVSLFSLSQL